MSRVLVFDLEAVPDADAGRRTWELQGTDAEVRAQMKALRLQESDGRSEFPKPAFWRIVALGVVAIDLGRKVRIRATATEDEAELVRALDTAIGQVKNTRLVSWSGNGFDLSVFRYRAILHGVPLPSLYGPPGQRQYDSYLYRYGEAHVDLMDALGNFGASVPLKLAECAGLCGLPCKTFMDGSDVERTYEAGEFEALRTYVEEDAVATAALFLRWEFTRARLSREAFDGELDRLLAVIDGRHNALAVALGRWRMESVLPGAAA